MSKPRLYSGMQPSADSLQIGNYIGALMQWRDLQEAYDAFFSVVDLHALTQPNDPAELREKTRRTAAQYIAAGIEPSKSTLYVQSHVAAHPELAWILSTITGFGEAGRMTQFKDKSSAIRRRCDLGRALHVPGADGGRHPALPDRHRAGRRRPEAARRADARPRRAVQLAVRRDVPRADAGDPAGHRAHLRPAEPHREDVEVRGVGCRRALAAGRARRSARRRSCAR